mmetsp:Transcript_100686/g.178765  ORF Transcript_100686/g.178765 Transcript_100686/m.178765 type:complete len:204 (+) Transcript_100686:539-1150(+)
MSSNANASERCVRWANACEGCAWRTLETALLELHDLVFSRMQRGVFEMLPDECNWNGAPSLIRAVLQDAYFSVRTAWFRSSLERKTLHSLASALPCRFSNLGTGIGLLARQEWITFYLQVALEAFKDVSEQKNDEQLSGSGAEESWTVCDAEIETPSPPRIGQVLQVLQAASSFWRGAEECGRALVLSPVLVDLRQLQLVLEV